MNYEEMSDFEINVAVAKAIGLDVQYQSMRNDGRVLVVVKLDFGVERYYRIPDYCSDWSDAGPVMVENRIGIYPSEGPDFMPWMASPVGSGLLYTDKNPLRAAMIAFLMMKDAEK